MEKLIQVVQQKLKKHRYDEGNPGLPKLPLLMLCLMLEMEVKLDWRMERQQDVEELINSLLTYSTDQRTISWLTQEHEEEDVDLDYMADQLEKAETVEQLFDLVILDWLIEAMKSDSDNDWPPQKR